MKKINNTEWRIPDLKAVLVTKFNAGEESAHHSPPVLQGSELGPSGVLQITPAYLPPHLYPLLPSAESRLHLSLHLCDLRPSGCSSL